MKRVLALVTCALAVASASAAPARRPLIVLVAVDTLRADRLGCYGYARATSPGFDRLAAGGVLFERAVSQASWTLPSFASLFTSKHPREHGLIEPARALRPGERSFVEALASAGYRTAAFADGPFFDRRYGFDRGFGRYETASGLPVEAVVPAALRWLDEDAAAPAFLFLHTMNVHAPYHAPPPYVHRFDGAYRGPVDRIVIDNYFLGLYNREPEPAPAPTPEFVRLVDAIRASPRDRDHIAAHYDDGVARVDGALEELWAGLKSRGLYDDAVVVLLSDHGEELGERGKFRHNHSVFDPVARVPLVVKLPAGAGAGRRVGEQVRLLDVGPTLLGLAGVAASTGTAGVDLGPLLAGGAAPALPEIAFTASDGPGGRHALFSARTARWKLVRSLKPATEALYDLTADPGETRDASKAHPEPAARLRKALDGWLGKAAVEAARTPLDGRLEEAIRAAGY